jgi:chemotaxis protein CheD
MVKRIHVNPGDLLFDRGEQLWETLLGSCIALTFWHPRQGWGAICHYLLPTRARYSGPALAPDGRYGDEALRWIVARMARAGASAAEFQVGMYGGGTEFDWGQASDVGKRNVDAGKRMLRELGIMRWRQDVLGFGHRKLYFNVANGEVAVDFCAPPPRRD